MNASKRKFNALIDGIGNKSKTTLAAKEVNNVPSDESSSNSLTKKRRVSDTTPITRSTNIPSSGTRRSPAAMRLKNSATTSAVAEAPKYAPWDREAFLKRLQSFSNILDWTPKPARVNEVEWAKRGWVCQKLERVRCCLCNVEILVKLNRKEADGMEEPVYVARNIEEALVDKYVELIVSSHDEGCLWRNRGCDDSIFKLPLNHTGTTFSNLRERYNELITRSEHLPYNFNMRTPPDFDLDAVITTLPTNFFTAPSGAGKCQPAEINRVALLMALFGWLGHTHERLGSQLGSVSCTACFRVLGLWLFKSQKVNEAGEEVVGAAMKCLNVVEEHRAYCPWRDPTSQNGTGPVKTSTSGMAGWEITIRILRNDHILRSQRDSPGKLTQSRTAPNSPAESNDTLGLDAGDDDAMSIRDEEDKKRFAKLRTFKNLLFETKGGKKLQ